MSADHYDTLGVPRGASAAEIKAARRRASSKAHPDRAGGSGEKIAAVNKAYAVLSDPARRAQYDQTGDDSEHAAPSVDAMAREVLRMLFTQLLEQPGKNLVASVTMELKQAMDGIFVQQKRALLAIRNLERRRAKIRVADGAANLAHEIIDGKVAELQKQLEDLKTAVQVNDRAKEMVSGYVDEEQEAPAYRHESVVLQKGNW